MKEYIREYLILERSLEEIKQKVRKGEMSKDMAKYVAEKNLATLKRSRVLMLINNNNSDFETKSKTMALVEKFDKLEKVFEEFVLSFQLTSNI